MRHFLTLKDFDRDELLEMIELARAIKAHIQEEWRLCKGGCTGEVLLKFDGFTAVQGLIEFQQVVAHGREGVIRG